MYPRLVGAIGLHCGDGLVAEEIAQEALASTWQRWGDVRRANAPESWTFRVAFNLTTSRFPRLAAERRANRRAGVAAESAPAGIDHADVLDIRSAVRSLPERQRAAIVLRYFAGLDVASTAVVMRCEPGTVRSLTSQAVAGLRDRLGVRLDEEDHEHV
jgi:RNA polymerase sigma factor (sigma-70 family)